MTTLTTPNKKFMLLATDGEPNCGGSPADIMKDDVAGASAAAASALAAGFPVYVVGIGPVGANLTQLAKSGGTNDYYPATSPEQLAEALTAISKVVGSCTYKVADPPPDSENVAVYVNKQQIAKDANEGWVYGDTNQDIVLTGSYCESINAGDDTKVQILFGCPGAPPFPSQIY
jgi:threonine dehydrogenase-like Zn-dependent dehydrogenase